MATNPAGFGWPEGTEVFPGAHVRLILIPKGSGRYVAEFTGGVYEVPASELAALARFLLDRIGLSRE